jgi:ubiquitin C-terminal hydrolase
MSEQTRGVLGLANLGNTCFINAVIQALRNCPEWTIFCTKDKIQDYISDPEKPCTIMLLAYQDLLKSIWGGSGPGYVKPYDFYNKLRHVVRGTIYDTFTNRGQQDSHEFLVWILDQMYMATQKPVEITIRNEEALPPMTLSAIKGWKHSFEKAYSPLTDLVFGMYRIQYRCTGCNTTHTRWETFNTLKVSIKHDSSGNSYPLDKLLELEFAEEDIDGYECDACKQKTLTKKSVSIWRLPKLLILTLKRFTPMGTRDNSPFNYDGEPVSFKNVFSSESKEDTKFKAYKVFGTVDHHGNHNGGHYTAQTFSPVWKVWHLYDDESAHAINAPQFGVYTYMMFFRPI